MTRKYSKSSIRFAKEHFDNCSECGHSFEKSDTTHLGYFKANKLAYVCDACSKKLISTIARHSYRKRSFKVPNDDNVLWRFMDFTKFASLLKTKSLFFTRADKFNDPFEGAKGLLKNKTKWDNFYKEFFTEAIKTAPDNYYSKYKDEGEIKKDSKRLLRELENISSKQVEQNFINCWHDNKYESEAMWSLYTSSLEQGVAVKTTYKRLKTALNKYPEIDIGQVNYIDYNDNFVSVNNPFWFKRKSFEHEREVRAIYTRLNTNEESGILIPVNLNLLIDKVYLSPTSQNWYKELVKDIMDKYGLQKTIKVSELSVQPFH